ncbi:hypothetical protein [Crocinitomix algicola]|uniref:hypothetical protein n=1 Tax=Crocinitomix algicola TaxID=1740263 RepID=UPI000871B61B|nr:hypothetical protein [Crocinitomix algicola]
MKPEIKYIELKSGFSDNGPAWIGLAEFSKSGQTVYFNDMALKKLKTPGIGANHFDIETGEEYWISGIKKNGQDRHWAGGGKVLIEESIIDDYLHLVDFSILDKNHFEVVNINRDFDKSRFDKIENEEGYIETPIEYYKWYWDNNKRKLIKE